MIRIHHYPQRSAQMPAPRIAIGAIFTECNEFGGVPIDLSWFERYELLRGEAILAVSGGVVGGMLQVLQEREAEPVPLLYASTCPGGPLTADCYAQLKGELLARLRNVLPVDGVLLPLHGAAVVEGTGDLEGDLIQAVRKVVGPAIPIVATLDLHAHITAEMVAHADALVAWETYPHRDAFTTGQRGARLLLDTVAGRCHPTMVMAKVPVITGGVHGSTEGDDPFAQIMRRAKALEQREDVLSTSVILVHPYLDQPDMGSGAVVITDGNPVLAEELAHDLAVEYWARRFDLEADALTPDVAIAQGLQVQGGPVVLVETADCAGGGAAGDSVATLRALLAANVAERSLVYVVDPQAAAHCQQAGLGAPVTLSLGHRLDPRWGEPMVVTGTVTRLGDGRFRYVGGIWDGVEGNMGPSAILTIGAVEVLVMTYATYDWMDEQLRAMDLEPNAAKFIVAKNPMNYRQAYPDAKAVFVLHTPGPTPATVRHLQFQRLSRPYFPLDAEIDGLTPMILRSKRAAQR
jgi:microcystin degradation protein MlrC